MGLPYHEYRDLVPDDLAFHTHQSIDHFFPDQRRILDIGCGKGELVHLLRCSGRNAYGIDIRPEADGIVADARVLPFADNSFSLVTDLYLTADIICLQGLSLTHAHRVATEAYRVLEPGGIFLGCPSLVSWTWTSSIFGTPVYRNGDCAVFQKAGKYDGRILLPHTSRYALPRDSPDRPDAIR